MIDTLLFVISAVALYSVKSFIQRKSLHLVLLFGGSRSFWLGLYTLLFLPGVVIHEVAHFLMASFLGVRSGEIEILPKIKEAEDGRIPLGSVKIARTDPIRGTLIGIAPVIVGITCLYLIIHLKLGITSPLLFATLPFTLENSLLTYLAIVIANTMFTSKEDLHALPLFALLLLLLSVLVYFFELNSFLTPLWYLGNRIPRLLMTSFSVTLALNTLIALLLTMLEALVSKISRKRIRYT